MNDQVVKYKLVPTSMYGMRERVSMYMQMNVNIAQGTFLRKFL